MSCGFPGERRERSAEYRGRPAFQNPLLDSNAVAKILIIGINYRPESTGIAPYTSDLAEHLSASGHRVTVITGFAHYPAWQVEPGEHRLRAAESRGGVRVLRRRHYV